MSNAQVGDLEHDYVEQNHYTTKRLNIFIALCVCHGGHVCVYVCGWVGVCVCAHMTKVNYELFVYEYHVHNISCYMQFDT